MVTILAFHRSMAEASDLPRSNSASTHPVKRTAALPTRPRRRFACAVVPQVLSLAGGGGGGRARGSAPSAERALRRLRARKQRGEPEDAAVLRVGGKDRDGNNPQQTRYTGN